MKRKRLLAAMVAAVLSLCVLVGTVGCYNDQNPDVEPHTCASVCQECGKCTNAECGEDACKDKCLGHEYVPTNDDLLAENLKGALQVYLQSDAFKNSVAQAKTAAAWVPLSYLKYVDGSFYTYDNARIFLKYLNMIDDLIVKSEGGQYAISDARWSQSAACAQGWYGVTDYLYTWSICYNLYLQYCEGNDVLDNHFDIYLQYISDYLSFVDEWLGGSAKTYDIRWISGDTITQSNLYYQGYNCFNSISYNRIKDYDYDYWVEFMGVVEKATGNTNGHEAFLAEYKTFWEFVESHENPTSSELRGAGANLLKKFKDCLPVTQVAFGFSAYSYIACIKANLGLDTEIANTDKYYLSYYEKNEDGTWKKEGGTPNWVGPSGRPVGASLYRDREEYSVEYEKSMQGYFPFTDGWSQPLNEMINLDRLCNYYNHDLGTGANVTPQWALLTAMMHGINMEHYKKVEPLVDEEKGILEDGSEEFNVITLWRNNLKTDEDGNFIISGNIDAAVAIAYLAMHGGVEAPTPLGVYSKDCKVIEI